MVPQLRKLLIGSTAPLRVLQDSTSMLGYVSHLYPQFKLLLSRALIRCFIPCFSQDILSLDPENHIWEMERKCFFFFCFLFAWINSNFFNKLFIAFSFLFFFFEGVFDNKVLNPLIIST